MPNVVRVVPAVLTDNPETLKTLLSQAETFTDFVQIDIMDGQFVPSRSITWEQIMGIQTKLKWEVHLMVRHPEKQLEYYLKAGACKAVFHFEATSSHRRVIGEARKLGLAVGMAVNPETPVSSILPFTEDLDSVLFLSVNPGFYGAKYIPEVLDKVSALRTVKPSLPIGIDGGIKENNIVEVAKSGANEICVGSAVFLQPDPSAAYRKLVEMVNQ